MSAHAHPRKRESRRKRIERKLAAYAVAAGAATAATGQEATAAIVHVDLDPDVQVEFDVFPLDLNKDGVDDFEIQHGILSAPPWSSSYMVGLVQGVNGSVVGSSSSSWRYASKLAASSTVGPQQEFQPHGAMGSMSYSYSTWGSWPGEGKGFAGVRFDINGEPHYGWIRMTVDDFMVPTIHDYAYETDPDTPVHIPEPCSLGMLALGAAGVTAMRKTRKARKKD